MSHVTRSIRRRRDVRRAHRSLSADLAQIGSATARDELKIAAQRRYDEMARG